MNTRYTAQTQRLSDAVLTSPGETDPILRCAVEAQAARLSGCSTRPAGRVPAEAVGYITKVALHAYRTTDQDIEALRTAGYSEDAIFEITLSAALGACLARLERGLAALEGGKDAAQED